MEDLLEFIGPGWWGESQFILLVTFENSFQQL